MASYNGRGPDDDSMELSNEEIDEWIRKHFEFIKHNLRVYDLITGSHIFDPIIPNNVLQKLKLKEPESRIKHAHKFLKEYLKSKYEGKGKILKDALLMRGPDSGDSLPSDHRLIWTALLSNTSDIDLAAHSHDQKLIQALQAEITECIECDEGWLSECLERGLITKKEFEEIRSLRDRSGTHRGNVMLLECITRTYQFLKTFLELLWDRGLEDLVRKIDKVTYEKFLAHETDGGSDDRPMRHDTVYMSGPVEGDDYAGQDNPNADQKHDFYSSEKQLNIPWNNLNDGPMMNDGPIASRTRFKTKEFGFQMSKKEYCCYDEGNSTVVNQHGSTFVSAPEMMNPSTTDTPRNSTGRNDRPLRNSDIYNRGYHSLEDEHPRAGRKTRQFGFQSPNTIACTQKAYTIPVVNEKKDEIPQTLKTGSSKLKEEHKDVKSQTKTSEDFVAPAKNKTSQQSKKSAKAQEDRNTMSRTHTDLSENTGSFVPKPHSETLKPQSQSPPNKLRTQTDKKPPRTPEHGERPEDFRNSLKKQEAMGKSTRSYDELNAESLKEIKACTCPFGKKKFVIDEKLQHHIETMCGAKGDHGRPRCPNCKKPFKDNETLKRHMIECSHTPQANNRPSDVRRCSTCNKPFGDKEKLEKHKKNSGHL
uniref:C2H2-type domain-containing protein n=1 Tax=Biomphalaria glabrata TaxID=6526 RepID=A0A2C9KQ97_BIOGL